jgi:hypothetical protein
MQYELLLLTVVIWNEQKVSFDDSNDLILRFYTTVIYLNKYNFGEEYLDITLLTFIIYHILHC